MSLQPSPDRAANPYATPQSRVDDLAAATDGDLAFFAVSLLKLPLMTLATMNIYQIYWFYRNWKCAQRLSNDKLNAPLRSIFYPLTSYSLFTRVRDQAQTLGVGVSIQAGLLAITVFVFSLTLRLPDPYWLVGFLGFLPLLPVQSAVNAINRKRAPDADPNSRFSGWNIFGLVVGGLLVFLEIVGTFIPAQ